MTFLVMAASSSCSLVNQVLSEAASWTAISKAMDALDTSFSFLLTCPSAQDIFSVGASLQGAPDIL